MGSEDLPAVGTSRFGGAVGVQDELPAAAVDADVVVELADQDAVVDGGLPAVLLVAQVVHVAVDRGRPHRGQAQVRSRSRTARRMWAGMVSL